MSHNVVTKIEVVKFFEVKTEERRFPKPPKGGSRPDPGWGSCSVSETDTEWVFTKSEELRDKPFYRAYLSSCVNAQFMQYNVEPAYGAQYTGPKSETPRQAVMALLDSMALAEKSAKS